MSEPDWEKLDKAVEWAGTRGRDPWGHGERILAAARWALEAHKRGEREWRCMALGERHYQNEPCDASDKAKRAEGCGWRLIIPLDSEEGT